MPKPRLRENKGLPARWKFQHGAYYYRVPLGLEPQWDGKQMFRLGKSLPEAYKVWADHLGSTTDVHTIGQLLDRYALEVVPTKAVTTQSGNHIFIKTLRAVFGNMPLLPFKPQLVYQYYEKRKAKVSAHREIEVLSHAYTKAIEWGLIERHPFKGEVRLPGEKPRTRYVEDWEIIECLALESRQKKGSVLAIQASMRIKLLTGMARSDLLRLTMSDLMDDGIHIERHKTAESTGKRTIYTWTDELRAAVNLAKEARPALSKFLFCNRDGQGYFNEKTGECHGWDSMWQRFIERVLKETKVVEKFNEHDLRAKCASDAESLEHARALLSHANTATTRRIYRRKAEIVNPLR